ncbi:unnamed protein product [Absidia cylindrospora]
MMLDNKMCSLQSMETLEMFETVESMGGKVLDLSVDLLNLYRVWAVYPDRNQVLVAVDGSDDDEAHEIRKFSYADFHGAIWDETMTRLTLSRNQRPARSVHNRLKMANEEMDDRLIKMFLGDGTGTYSYISKSPSNHHQATLRGLSPTVLPPSSQHKSTKVCLGVSRSADSQTRALIKRYDDVASERCSACFNLTLVAADGPLSSDIQKCQSCGKMWQREVNAARNIRSMAIQQITDNALKAKAFWNDYKAGKIVAS